MDGELKGYCLFGAVLDGEAELPVLVLAEADHAHDIPEMKHILNFGDPRVRDLGNVNQAFLARSKFKECTEILDGNDFPGEDHILFKFRYDKPDRFLGGLHLLL